MTQTLHRGPEPGAGQVVLRPPPERSDSEGAAGAAMNAVPMLGSLGSIVLVSSMGGEHRARGLVAAGLILFATLGFVLVQVDRQRRQRALRATGSRDAYLRHLAGARRAARESSRQQRRALLGRHPDPRALPALAAERTRLWPGDADGAGEPGEAVPLAVRFGVCPRAPWLELVPPDPDEPGGPVDAPAAAALARLLHVHRVAPGLPATVDLRSAARIELCGEEEPARSLARALLCSATAGHGPGRLRVAVLCAPAALPHWDWLKWLPHARSPRARDAVGAARMIATDAADLATLLPDDVRDRPAFGAGGALAEPHLLLLVDGAPPDDLALDELVPPAGRHGVTVLDLPERWDDLERADRLRLELTGPGPASPTGEGRLEGPEPRAPREVALAVRPGAETGAALADRCDRASAEAFARRLAPLPATPPAWRGASGAGPPGSPGLAELLGTVEARAADGGAAWRARRGRDRLRVPIGVGADGSSIHLDLKEAAERGMGPHGLVVGATGSGKSELLRTLVLGLALTHAPEQLAMVLVDFKGGATFTPLGDLPHVSAVITNLEAELTLVDRMQDALSGEVVRRQELLRRTGHASVRDYEDARSSGADLDPLPSLVVVVDEFTEMLAARPELLDLFVAVGRLGRSLGLHLLLASQRLEEGRLRGLESHLSYRIGLRTFSPGESRAVLGVPDAAALPSTPGVGYLRPDPETLRRFHAACVSDPARPAGGGAPGAGAAPAPAPGILPFPAAPVRSPAGDGAGEPVAPDPPEQPSVLDLAVRRLAGAGPRARRIWLPPLDLPDTLGGLMPDLVADPALGLVSPHWRDRGPYVVPVGVLDRPREQRRDTLAVDLRGSGGHLAVVGGPRSGRSTLLRTTVAGLALTTTPLETQVLVLDLGGGTFGALAGLPHVAGLATAAEPEVARRVVAEATGLLERRERSFRAEGIDSMETYRARRARGETDDGWGDLFVVVDGWAGVGDEDVEAQLQHLAARGLGYGVHLLVATTRWADLRPAVRDALGTRLELRLGDPLDSEVDRRAAALVPAGRPGRGLTRTPHHFLGALPRLEQQPDPDSLTDGVDALVRRSAAAWAGPTGPRLRLLPAHLDLEDVRRRAAGALDSGALLLGVEERELAPAALDPDRDRHLLVLGEAGSGKTATLRAYAHEVLRTRTAAEAQLLVVDYRRALLGEVPEEYLLDHLTSASHAGPALGDLAARLEERLPGPGVTPAELGDRSWWSGPEVFVLVDDYDLVTTTRESPVAALEHLLARATDVGLHLVVARRSGGASRALHEPVLQTLRDLAVPGLLLAGSPDEGPLLGPLRPAPAAPGRARLLTRDRGAEVVQLAWPPTRGTDTGHGHGHGTNVPGSDRSVAATARRRLRHAGPAC